MVDTSGGIGSTGQSTSLSGVRESQSRDGRAARGAGVQGRSGGGEAFPNGPRGRRMLAASTPVESLDRTAPRGTYLDLLV